MRIEIFKAGKHTDSSGNVREWTEADLDSIVSKYDPEAHEAPVVVGHPKDNAPAYGWAKKLERVGATLFAELGDLTDEFKGWLDNKHYKKRSISLYPDLSLRHIGFLGAQPPAVKGLADFAFAEQDAATYEFADYETAWSLNSVGRLFQKMRDWLIDTKDLETADRLMPQHEIDSLKEIKGRDMEPKASFTEPNQGDIDMAKEQELQTEIDSLKAANADFAERLTAETARADKAEGQVKEITVAAEKKAVSDFCEKLIGEGKLLPAEKEFTEKAILAQDAVAEIEFSEGDSKVKATERARYMDHLSKREKQIEFSEVAKQKEAVPRGADDKLTLLTNEKIKANPSLNFNEASRQVLAENPELNLSV